MLKFNKLCGLKYAYIIKERVGSMKKWYVFLVMIVLSVFLTACIKVQITTPKTEEKTAEEDTAQTQVQETSSEPEETAEDSVAAQGSCGPDATWTVDKSGTLTISGKGATYDGWKIADEMTRNNDGRDWDTESWEYPICRIVVREGITEIGEKAFRYCENVTEAILPDGLEKIGARAFEGCGFRDILLPDSLLEVGEYAFLDTGMVSVTIPRRVEKIGYSAFGGGKLEGIFVDLANEHYTSIDGCLYSKDQTVLIQYPPYYRGAAQIAEDTQTIAFGAFANCRYVTQVKIPSGVTKIEAGAFHYCEEVSIEVSNNPYYKMIDGMLYHSPTMTLVYCPYRTDVVIPKGTNIIGAYALKDCNIYSVTIPESVEIIEENAFGFLESVPIHYEGTWEAWQKIDIRDSNVFSVSVYTK